MRVAIVTNIPAPYRMPVYERLATEPDIELCVFFFSGREPDRHWNLDAGAFRQVFLRERFISFAGRFIHANPDVWQQLRAFRPDVIVTTGFNPSHLLAFAYARLYGARHIAMTDGTYRSEAKLSPIHRWVRRRVFARSEAFIGASDGAFELYRSYGLDDRRMFKSHLCANNQAFFTLPFPDKRFDFIFCGRFVAIKNPLFAIELARHVAPRLGRKVSILFVGSGEMEAAMRTAVNAAADHVEATFGGFARQEELPGLYASARIFVFPTQWDPWGVVANEACAAGLPLLVTPVAGSAGELIRDGENGYVMPLDIQQWGDAALRLLSDETLYASMSVNSLALVREYSFDNAATGIANAIRSASPPLRPRVVIMQRRLTHYRVPLFGLMHEKLDKMGIDFDLIVGDPTPAEQSKGDSGLLPWGIHIPCVYGLGGRLCWQNAGAAVRSADLVVVTQENRLLFNYFLFFIRRPKALAYWGHGRNFQATDRQSLSERFKRYLASKVDWWFAYTATSAQVVEDEAGFPRERITVLNNSIDTQALAADLADVSDADVREARRGYGIGTGPVGIMLASLHADKKIDFLIEAARHVRQKVPNFELLIVGDGPERPRVAAAVARENGWIHWLGVRTGRDKAVLLSMARVMLNPGMVGLGILDSFMARLPMVTSECGFHSPEIAYLEDGINGLKTANDVAIYAQTVVALLNDDALNKKLQRGCERSAEHVSLEKMATRFCDGIVRSLEQSGVTCLQEKTA